MKKALLVVDMQNDFVTGSLGTKEAQAIVPGVAAKIQENVTVGNDVIFTRDTHSSDYLKTREGENLPVEHCIANTKGWEIIDCLKPYQSICFDKPTFGSVELVKHLVSENYAEIEIIGLCTDICVVSNALLIKAHLPEMKIKVDAACCAGVTPESHKCAIETMKMCQIEMINA